MHLVGTSKTYGCTRSTRLFVCLFKVPLLHVLRVGSSTQLAITAFVGPRVRNLLKFSLVEVRGFLYSYGW